MHWFMKSSQFLLPAPALCPWSCLRSRCRLCWAWTCHSISRSTGCAGTASPPAQFRTPAKIHNSNSTKKLPEIGIDWGNKMFTKYLVPVRLGGVSEHTGLGFANEVAEGIHFECAVEIWERQRWIKRKDISATEFDKSVSDTTSLLTSKE